MALTLTIENMSSLPDGGPLSITIPEKRGIDIGRNAFLDWTLPDPTRFISGKHCEVRYQDGEFLLYDVSTNGTFLNGAQRRMQSPHRLRTGDRLLIGDYVVIVSVDVTGPAEESSSQGSGVAEYWASDVESAPPIDPRSLRAPPDRRAIHSDFLEQAMGSPDLYDIRGKAPSDSFDTPPSALPAAEQSDAFDWAPLSPRPAPEVEPQPQAPTPRRAVAPSPSVDLWGDPAASVAPDDPFAAPMPPPAPAVERPEPVVSPPVSQAEPLRQMPGGDADFVRTFAQAAGLPPEAVAHLDGTQLAQMSGQIMRTVVAEMMQLMTSRSEARRLMRNPNQTMINATDNNPLKFAPSPEEALAILLGPRTRSYLDAQRAFAQGFKDIKSHQVLTYAAMQAAVRRLAQELDPAEIEKALPPAAGIGERLGSQKSRLWDFYSTRWQAKTEHHDDGLVDLFMLYFGDCYTTAGDGER